MVYVNHVIQLVVLVQMVLTLDVSLVLLRPAYSTMHVSKLVLMDIILKAANVKLAPLSAPNVLTVTAV